MDGCKARVMALVHSGSFHTFIREDKLPAGAMIIRAKEPKTFGLAETGTKLTAVGSVYVDVRLENHDINAYAFVAPNLSADMIIGAGEMQRWDITIKNDNGHTDDSYWP